MRAPSSSLLTQLELDELKLVGLLYTSSTGRKKRESSREWGWVIVAERLSPEERQI